MSRLRICNILADEQTAAQEKYYSNKPNCIRRAAVTSKWYGILAHVLRFCICNSFFYFRRCKQRNTFNTNAMIYFHFTIHIFIILKAYKYNFCIFYNFFLTFIINFQLILICLCYWLQLVKCITLAKRKKNRPKCTKSVNQNILYII